MTSITVSSLAASKITEELSKDSKQESGLRVYVQGGGCSGFQYGLIVEDGPGVGDQVFESNGVKLYVDPISVRYLKGAEIDWIDNIAGGGFTIRNPNAKSTCGCGQSFQAD
jgi:iron-sulfur cluster assembly accessory protein